jgi:putative colanic acid biosynthesis acetyltransferase WcaF
MQKTDLSNYTNTEYRTGASLIGRMAWYIVNACFFNSAFPVNSIKLFLLKCFGARVGRGVVLKPSVNIKYPWNLVVGNHVWIGEQVWLDSLGTISIGDNSCVSQGAMLICGNHNYKKSTFNLIVEEIILEEGVWIGAGAMVCGGCHAQSHAMVTAGSVVSGNLAAYSVYKGNPATKIKDRIIE